jgi:hypothetical protein
MAATGDLAGCWLILKRVELEAVGHHVPILKELLQSMNAAVSIAGTEIRTKDFLDVIFTVEHQNILESEDRMPV